MARGGAKLGTSVLDLDVDDSRFHSKLSGAAKAAQNFTSQAGTSLAKAGKAISGVGDSMTRNVTLPILAAGGATAKLALDFDTTMRQIVGLAKVPKDEIEGVGESIKKMAVEVGRSPQELAEAFYFVASAGFEANEAMEVLEISGKAAASGMGQTQDIAKVLGGVINAYGHENITAARAGDILTAAIQDGSAEAADFAGVIGTVVPSAAALGVSFDQVTAALSGMTLTGTSADEAATQLTQVFSGLLKPTAQAEEAMQGLGLSSAGLRQELKEKGLLATLRTLEERFAGNDTAAAAVFGNIRALRGITGLLTLDTDQLNGIFADTAGALDTLQGAYDATEGPQRDLDRSMAELQATAIEIGTDVLPMVVEILGKVADAAAGLSDWWGTLDDETKQLIVQALAFLAIAGPVLLIVGKLTTGVGNLFKVVAFLSGAKGLPLLITKLHLTGAASLRLLGPIGLLVGAALAAREALDAMTGGQLSRDSAVKDMVDNTGDIGKATQKLADGAKQNGDDFLEFGSKVRTVMDETGLDFDRAVNRVLNGVPEISDALLQSARDWEAYQRMIRGGTASAVDAAALEAAGLPPEIAALLTEGAGPVGDGADAMTAEMVAAAQKARDEAVKAMSEMLTGMSNLFDSDQSVRDAWQGLIDRMDDPYTEAERKADIFSKATIANIRAALAVGDPAIAADTVILVNNMLGQFALMEPGALESGNAVPPAIREGMDAQVGALITWIEENVTGESLAAMELDAVPQGLEAIASYARGMERNERLAWLTANAIRVTAKERFEFDASSGGASVVSSWLSGMTAAIWAQQGGVVDAISYMHSLFGGSLPTEGPLKGGVGSGGQSIGESWIHGLVVALDAGLGAIEGRVGTVGDAMSLAPRIGMPSMPGVAGIATHAAGVGGVAGSVSNVSYQWNLSVEGTERTVSTKREALDELERMSTSWG